MNLMETTNPKTIIDTKQRESKTQYYRNSSITKKESKGKNELRITTITTRKQLIKWQ